MRLIGLLIGALVIVAGVVGFAAPGLGLSFERAVLTSAGPYAIAAFRIAIGLLIVFAARTSRSPLAVRALGVMIVVAGVFTPLFGVARALAVVDWLSSTGPLLIRLDAIVGIAVGGFLVNAFRTPKTRSVDGALV